jgi:hypothetical protein
MFNPKDLAPEVFECSYEAKKGKSVVFHVREPSGREIMEIARKARNKKGNGEDTDSDMIENCRESFSRFIVNEDGSAITKEQVEGLIDMGFVHMRAINEIVNDKIGIADKEKKS